MSDINKYKTIFQNALDSKCILINQYKVDKNNDEYFIISFKKTIIFIKRQSLQLLNPIFSISKNLLIYFLPNANKDTFNQHIKSHNNQYQCDTIFLDEINNFNSFFNILIKIESNKNRNTSIASCISGYLIQESYIKLNKTQSAYIHHNENEDKKEKSMNDYIILRKISNENFSQIELVYEIENGELFACKTINENYEYLLNREYNNYLQINYPLLPKLNCKIKSNNSIIIQFINGKTLKFLNEFHFSYEEKIAIIFQIMLSINYLHEKDFIYIDLKPNNIMIDENKTVFLIDFDHMIKIINDDDNEVHTTNFSSKYAAPEINHNEFSDKNDIYSIGKIIYYIMCEKTSEDEKQNITNFELFQNNKYLFSIYKRCINSIANQRPSISDLIFEFYVLFFQQINKMTELLMHDLPEVKYFHDIILFKNDFITTDSKNAIRYLSIMAKYNDINALFLLGNAYYHGKIVKQDINKAIEYYKLASDRNHYVAQYNLGLIYFKGEFIPCDINKAINYLALASDHDYSKAQYIIGFIKSDDLCNKIGVDKAIHYYTLSAKQNNDTALFYLGNLYIHQDINKCIYYFELSANLNNPYAQFNLGYLYLNDKYTFRDIKKGIHYLTLSADQNIIKAQFLLGLVYAFKKTKQDMKKAIHYFTLAAEQNDIDSQYCAGFIYAMGDKEIQDINKAIHYLSLAADKNNKNAQFALGLINFDEIRIRIGAEKAFHYYLLSAKQNNLNAMNIISGIYSQGVYVEKNINMAIYYLECAAKQGFRYAQFNLGLFYEKGEYLKKDINKAIYYYSCAVDQNCTEAQYQLGVNYIQGKNITRNIKKGIYYLTLAAEKNYPIALYALGVIYFENTLIEQNINKAFYYLSQSAKLNYPKAQYYLGLIFIYQNCPEKNKIIGIDFLIQSSLNEEHKADFLVGYFYHEGKYIQRDYDKLLKYYKDGSSFNDQYAKNNLGIIYKNGLGKAIQKNIGRAISYFEHAIHLKNDMLSMYNLSHIYIYEDSNNNRINESIKLLMELSKQNFQPANELLSIALIKKHEYNCKNIKKELTENQLHFDLYKMMVSQNLFNKSFFDVKYQYYQNIDFLYNYMLQPILSSSLKSKKIVQTEIEPDKNISNDFYDGFGVDINTVKHEVVKFNNEKMSLNF